MITPTHKITARLAVVVFGLLMGTVYASAQADLRNLTNDEFRRAQGFVIGCNVEGKFGGKWYPGKILATNGNGTYRVRWWQNLNDNGTYVEENGFTSISDAFPQDRDFCRLRTGYMQIFVKTLNGSTITLDLKPDEPVISVMDKIEANIRHGFPKHRQYLIFGGSNLERSRTLNYYKIRRESTLHLCMRLGQSRFSTPSERDILSRWQEAERRALRPEGQKAEQQADEEATWSPMQIFVKTLNGGTITLNVEPDEPIISVMDKIENKEGVVKYKQSLIYGGKNLQRSRTLNDYNIQNDSTISLVMCGTTRPPLTASERDILTKWEERRGRFQLVGEVRCTARCPVCQYLPQSGSLIGLACGHAMCPKCLCDCLERTHGANSAQCPVCRKDAFTEDPTDPDVLEAYKKCGKGGNDKALEDVMNADVIPDGMTTEQFLAQQREIFEQSSAPPPGIEVTGAGDAQMNGWYRRKEHAEGPPRGWSKHINWTHVVAGPHWYEKDDGCFIWRILLSNKSSWSIRRAPEDFDRYVCNVPGDADSPPRQGWKHTRFARAPAPTLQMVP